MPASFSLLRFQNLLLAAACAASVASSGCSGGASESEPKSGAKTYDLLVGSFTEGRMSSGKSRGVSVFRFDAESGETTPLAIAEGVRNPSWIAVSKDGKFVYTVNELSGVAEADKGAVSAFAFDAATGALKLLNKVPSGGDDPCHLWFDETGRRLFVSHYSSGSFAVMPLKADGSLLPPEQIVSDVSGPRRGRLVASIAQENGGMREESRDMGRDYADKKSHVHSITPLPDGSGIVVADLGWDRVIRHAYSPGVSGPKSLELAATVPVGVRNRKGFPAENITVFPDKTGPRHLVFDKAGKHAFVVGELGDTVTTLEYAAGKLTPVSHVLLGTEPEAGAGTAGAIHLSADGKFLYVSARKPKNAIVVFSADPATGALKQVQSIACGGKAPREFSLSPDGRRLLVANQDSDNIVFFDRDPGTGMLTPTGRILETGSPTDLKWVPAP